MQYLAVGCRAAIAVIFLLAAGGKLVGPGAFSQFRQSVIDMRAVPAVLVTTAARATVAAELLAAVLVLIPTRSTGVAGCALGLVLTALFTNAIVASIRSGRRTACRCFGRTSTPLGTRHLIRNGVLLAVTALGLATCTSGASVALAGALVGVVAGLFLGLIVASFDELADLLRPA